MRGGMDSIASREREKAVTVADWRLRAWVLASRHKFSCMLAEEPSALVPRGGRDARADDTAAEIVNPTFRYQAGPDLPHDLHPLGLPMHGCLREYPIAWIMDPRSGAWLPFWGRGEFAEALSLLRAGEPVPTTLSAGVRRGLARAEIVVPIDHQHMWSGRRAAMVQAARAEFQHRGYVIVRDLIQPVQLGALRAHYRALIATGGIPKGDWIEQRYGLHSELMATFLHLQLQTLVNDLAGEPVKPSYVYFASYREGADLPRHTDRAQSELSISLLVDYSPEPDGPCGWPLYMESPRRTVPPLAADLRMGDGVFYRGREIIHYRDPLPRGHHATLIFFNYVRADYAGRLW